MSLSQPIAACPLLLEHDVLQLHKDLRIVDNSIVDAVLGLTHQALPSAYPLLFLLSKGVHYKDLVGATRTQRLSDSQLHELLGFLQISGGLVRHRSLFSALKAAHRYIFIFATLGPRAALAYRHREGPLSLLKAIILSSMAVIMSGLAIAYGMALSLDWNLWIVMSTAFFSLSLLVCSIYAHETGHILLLKKYRIPLLIVRQGLRIGILHPSLPAKQEAIIALTGPIVGAIVCIITGLLSLHYSVLYALICAVLAAVHCTGLLPWYGDGKSLRRAFQSSQRNHI